MGRTEFSLPLQVKVAFKPEVFSITFFEHIPYQGK
jgi:hypothetical protein